METPSGPAADLPARVGVLLVGVEDDGTVSGARPRHEAGRTDPLRVQALIANMTQPALSTVAGIVQIEGVEVLVVEVPDSPRVVGTTKGTYIRRAVAGDGRPTCVPCHAREMLAHVVDRGAVDWAGSPGQGRPHHLVAAYGAGGLPAGVTPIPFGIKIALPNESG